MSGNQIRTLEGFEKEELISILQEQLYPVTTKQVRIQLKNKGIRVPEYVITRVLREMIVEDKVRFKGGRWMRPELKDQIQAPKQGFIKKDLMMPDLSSEGSKGLTLEQDTTSILVNKVPERGPWLMFRKLLSYYLDCIRDEGGADAYSYQDKLGKEFIYINGTGNWYPQAGRKWNYILPLGDHIQYLQRALASKDDNVVVLGYPLEAYKNTTPEGEYTLVRPVFYYVLDIKFTEGSISFSMNDPQPEISAEWMKYALKNHAEQYHFLSACGLINQPRPLDEAIGFTSLDLRPGLDDLTSTLSGFMPKRVKEKLAIRSITADVLPSNLKPGIYNRAVIMVASKTKYTQTLIKELLEIGRQPDDILNQTSLQYIFKENKSNNALPEVRTSYHESIVADLLPLNAEQREATASLMKDNISVVTGPPGTGKSQVVVSAVANARIFGQSVLFSSRNHKAIDAVYDRARDQNGNHLIVRANSRDDPSVKYSFSDSIDDLLSKTVNKEDEQLFKRRVKQLKALLNNRGETAHEANVVQGLRDEIGKLEEEVSWLTENLTEELCKDLYNADVLLPLESLQLLDNAVSNLSMESNNISNTNTIVRIFSWLGQIRPWKKLRSQIMSFSEDITMSLFPPFSMQIDNRLNIKIIHSVIKFFILQQKISPLELKLKDMPPLEKLVKDLASQNELIYKLAQEILKLQIQISGGLEPNSLLREKMASLRVALRVINRSFDSEKEKKDVLDELATQVPFLLNKFPCWGVTNLSVGSKTPLVPGMFDLSIIDEASQCDIPSAIPILFRSKRAAVVGDPNQLKHVHNLTLSKDSLLRKKAGLSDFKSQRFSYRETSLYDLFAQTNTTRPHLLRDTYRSSSEIAEYSNSVFYKGVLRVATNETALVNPMGIQPGIHWSDVQGEVRSAGRSGCVCDQEINEVYRLVKSLLVENNYKGSLGIVTPFRIQANRLRDKLFDEDIPATLLDHAEVVVDTSHGFQGDEKDVMIFSLCGGPDMPDGSRLFLKDSANLFNVSVSRARAVLHIVGNRKWAENSNIPHIVALANPIKKSFNSTKKSTPWSPYESPWEKILADELIAKGMEPIPQYPLAGRRLDLALVDKKQGKYIDIEVDGDRFHRNPDGSRKKDDLWRDITVQGHGWIVKRFWVYRLKENMSECISEIEAAWRKND